MANASDPSSPRPLDGIPAVVMGTGPDLPADRLTDFREHFTIGVNSLWQKAHYFLPRVSFWIDGDVPNLFPAWHASCLCVCDRSAAPTDTHLWDENRPVSLPAFGGTLPVQCGELSPYNLILRPNTAVVAALWALSLGCAPVVMLGCGCEADDRRPDQHAAMTAALSELGEQHYRVEGEWRDTLWLWPRCVIENPVMWASYTLCPRMVHPGGDEAVRRIREFYCRTR